MARQVDPLVAFARKHQKEMFTPDVQARMDELIPTLEKSAADMAMEPSAASPPKMAAPRRSRKVARRADVNPKSGLHKYGRVQYADPTNKKYPIDTEKHVRAAWDYIHHAANAAKYEPGDLAIVRGHIAHAARQYGIKLRAPIMDKSEDADTPFQEAIQSDTSVVEEVTKSEPEASGVAPESTQRFMSSGPCVGDEYETVPRAGFSLKDTGEIREVLPNGMVSVLYKSWDSGEQLRYIHRVELTNAAKQGRIALVKSGSALEAGEIPADKLCRKCRENEISRELPSSGYCDTCLTVTPHWW